MKKKALLIGLLILVMSTTIVFAAPVLIDDFTTGAQVNFLNSPATWDNSAAGAMIGGERDLYATTQLSPGNFSIIQTNLGAGTLGFSAGSGVAVTLHSEWDGIDGTGLSLNSGPTSLNGTDLTGGGTNDGVLIGILNDDVPSDMTVQIYSGPANANWSQATISLPGDIVGGAYVGYFIPFTSFTIGGGTGMDQTLVDAIVIDANTVSLATDLDLTFNLFTATSARDFGDLPDTYTTLLPGGPRHITIDGLRLGSSVDVEPDGQPSVPATGDDLIGTADDGDGIVITPGSANTFGDGTGDIQITVSGGAGCLIGWFDWNQSGTFQDVVTAGANELILNQYISTPGTNTYPVTTPTNPSYNYPVPPAGLYARYRLFPVNDPLFTVLGLTLDGDGCPTGETAANILQLVGGEAAGGEVEDYFQQFAGPTAISMQTFGANSGNSYLTVVFIGVPLLTLVTIGFVMMRRRGEVR